MNNVKRKILKFRIKLKKVSRLPIIKLFFKKEEKKFGWSEAILLGAVIVVISLKFYYKLQQQLNCVDGHCHGPIPSQVVDELN